MRIRAMLLVTNLVLALFASPLPARAEWAGEGGFCDLVEPFVSAWTTEDVATLDKLIDPSIGFWVIHKLGVARLASRFRSIGEPLAEGEHGFAYLGAVGFRGCHPERGPAPVCSGTGELEPLCRFGEAEPGFIEVLEANLDEAVQTSKERIRLRQELEEVNAAAKKGVYFISDQQWGAVFYFVRMGNEWRLLAVDTSDCSA